MFNKENLMYGVGGLVTVATLFYSGYWYRNYSNTTQTVDKKQ